MAVDEYTWVLSEIRAEFRILVGLSSTSDISDANCNKRINDYYVNYFPKDAKIQSFDGEFTQATTAVDDGEYSIGNSYTKLMAPMFIDGYPVQFFQDYDYFREAYPILEQYITTPTLAVGSSDAAKVLTSAFTFRIAGYGYSKASAETTFSGLSTVPQNKYGAFCLKIDNEGTITIYEADDNSTGYDSVALAIAGLPSGDSDTAYLGYVTVISTDSGGFIPGTTELSAAAVTDTYTDGDPSHRGIPEGAYIGRGKLILGPKPNDIFQFKCSAEMTRPSALTGDTVAPADPKNGRQIAIGAAALYLAPRGDKDRLADVILMSDYCLDSIKANKRFQMRGRVAEPNF